MHSPTLANDFSFRLTLAFATFQPISFSLRSMPPQQIPCSHTLADSCSLFALFSTLASFVFNNLRTLCAKHRGCGYLCDISAPSVIICPFFVSPLFSWSYNLLFPQPLYFDNHLRCPPGCGVRAPLPIVFNSTHQLRLCGKFSFCASACYRPHLQGGF